MLVTAGSAPPRGRVAPAARTRAMRLHAFGEPPRPVTLARPVPTGQEVLLRVLATAVDLHDVAAAAGLLPGVHLPAVLGHAVSGEVVAAGPDVCAPAPGTPVAVHGAWGCGVCALCRAGEEQLCARPRWCGSGAAGGFAEHLLVPHARHLVELGGLDPGLAAPLAGEGLWTYRAVRRCLDRLVPGTAAVVLGAGVAGQMAVQMLKALSAVHVIAVDPDPRHEAAARESGADAFVRELDAEAVYEALAHRPAVAVLDLEGSDAGVALGAALVAPQGRVVATGLGLGRLAWSPATVAPEAMLSTTRWGSRSDLVEVLALARAGRIFVRTDRHPLEHAPAALLAVEEGGVDGSAVLVP